MRRILRRAVPYALRWRLRSLRRATHDVRHRVAFAARRDALPGAFAVSTYERRLRCYPGQEAAFAAKRANIALAMRRLDNVVVLPGQTLSFWQCVGRPTAAAGYGKAAALKDGVLTSEVGGAICFVSTILYNAMLLSGMTISERFCHSVDSYGDARYFELGRDASVEYAYRDLRARNDLGAEVVLRASLDGDVARIDVLSSRDLDLTVQLDVQPVHTQSPSELAVRTTRNLCRDGFSWSEDLGASVYRVAAAPRR